MNDLHRGKKRASNSEENEFLKNLNAVHAEIESMQVGAQANKEPDQNLAFIKEPEIP